MSRNILIGNIVSLLSMVVIMFGGLIKEKKKFIFIQMIHNILCVVCNIFLNAPVAVVTSSTGCVRDFLTYKKKMNVVISVVISLIMIGASVVLNGTNLLGYLPLVAIVPYAFLITKANDIQTKWLTIYIMVLWSVYDFIIFNYMGALFDVITIVTSVIGIVRIKRSESIINEDIRILLADAA